MNIGPGVGGLISIDGSRHSGSGTLLRHAAALSCLTRQPLHIYNIRARRPRPGLRPQHLKALQACSEMVSGRLEGAEVGSREIRFHPGRITRGGVFHWDIGTAGSTTMLAFTLIPVAFFADAPSVFSLTGGLFQDFAPSAHHMQRVLIPLLRRMGGEVELEILRPGYVPQGGGHLQVRVNPLKGSLRPLRLTHQGKEWSFRGVSLASHLREENVSRRMASAGEAILRKEGFDVQWEIEDDFSAPQKGAALLVYVQTETGCLMGADQSGKPGRRSERIGEFVIRSLLEDLRSQATTDRHLADQLILFAALAAGRSEYIVPQVTDHVQSNLWLVKELLGADFHLEENLLRIDGIGFTKSP